jgi:hypothetical protein
MSLTGDPKPTRHYPRFRSGPVTLDLPDPVLILPQPAPLTALVAENIVATGQREVLLGRLEEAIGISARIEPEVVARFLGILNASDLWGSSFQFWLDRFTGSCWLFNDTLKDQNGLALTLGAGSALTYADTAAGRGVVLAGTNYLTVATAQASAATPTGYDDPLLASEGVLVVDFKPSWAAADSTEHNIVVIGGFTLYKDTSDRLVFQTGANAGDNVSGAVSWAANARVQIVAEWFADGTRALWYAVNAGSFTALTSSSGSPAVVIVGATLYIGANASGANRALGTYDTIAFYKRAYANPHLTLASNRPWRRNHFPYAALIDRTLAPTRVSNTRDVYDLALTIRHGVQFV